MRLSVITAVKDNVVGLQETLNGIVVAVAAAPEVEVQLLVVAPTEPSGEADLLAVLAATQHRHANSGGAPSRLTIQRVVDPGSGISAAFNMGLQQCVGDWITVLNAGDLWFEDSLVNVERAARERPDAILHSAVTYEDEQAQRYVVASDPERVHIRMTLFHPTLFVPAAVYADVGNYSEAYRLAMDSHWCHRARALGIRFLEVPQSLAVMRLGGVSDHGFALALDEFRRSVVESGLLSPVLARFHCLRVKTLKRVTHFAVIRRLRSWLRASAQLSGQS